MSAYTYTTVVGDTCCYFGQVDKIIPQPGDRLLNIGLCQCLSKVTAQLKAGESVVPGEALYMDVAGGLLTASVIAGGFYGISKEGVIGVPGVPSAVTVYTSGGFNTPMVTVGGVLGAVTPALILEARGVGIQFEARV